MTGRLSDRDYYTVRDEYHSNQLSLDEWNDTDETLIAVVRKPRDTEIEKMCDEWWPELGMPEWALIRFWETRAGYRTNSAVSDPHNKAYEDCKLDGIYNSYLRKTGAAQDRIDEIVDRLDHDENIVLVCFEKNGQQCHRHTLLDVVESRRSSRFELTT